MADEHADAADPITAETPPADVTRHPSADAETIRRKLPVPMSPDWLRQAFAKIPERVREWFTDPDFSIYFLAFMVVAAALFLRQPSGVGGGFVFDEQEAILANPFVRGKQPWMDAFRRDFWGLLPDRSIGSYRPIPNLLWRALWRLQEWRSKGTGASPINTPFVWFNLVFHATNAALLSSIVRGVYKKVSVAWLAGAIFCACAVLTEAISGIVGIADVLGGLSLLLCLASLGLHPGLVLPSVFAATVFGLLSKETAILNVGLVPLAALVLAPSIDPKKPRRWERTIAALLGTIAACAFYAFIRHKYFHLDISAESTVDACMGKSTPGRLAKYIGAPNLPVDPFNNPLADPAATCARRIGGALRVYARGVGQVLAPIHLSPDYSFPQEPLPAKAVFFESILGALLFIVPPAVGVWLWVRGERRDPADDHLARATGSPLAMEDSPLVARFRSGRKHSTERSLLAYCLIAWPAAFFPLANIVKTLPTVRAERFWYTSALATSIILAVGVGIVARQSRRWWYVAAVASIAFLGFQATRSRMHASHFKDDLAFWRAAASAVPNSAKAHLNYSVMLGARSVELWGWTAQQAQEARLIENIRAADLAPQWDMAFIYVGDTLCQLNRMDEAWGWYVKGFRIGPQNSGLIALALQCLSDHNALLSHETEANALIAEKEMAGSWLAYLVRDTLDRERKCRGVDTEETIFGDAPAEELAVPEPGDEFAEPFGSNSGTPPEVPAVLMSSSATAGKTSSSSSVSSSASVDASASASGEIVEVPDVTKAAAPLPPCGVDPKYRPRGLDGDPKGD